MIFYKGYCADVVRVSEDKSIVVGSTFVQVPFWKSACSAYQSMAAGLLREYGSGHKIIMFRRIR